MTEAITTLDLYAYGRATHDRSAAGSAEESPAYVCIGCGSSATARDRDLVRHLGWRLLQPGAGLETERPVLCPRCARRSLVSLRSP